eukprot:CAMPEP_0169340056 /NCGR_PEP_ID=MMETSP1017-20121227/18758_1 /TAXON_ID=342587 /ORGANISM="Karlodinium micrum, Strain CCMP2283" /LENGTH=119 /DNA_ID=CAMNT_0009435657 /DNA_START=839 /DNA_END=1198 /DNA_ORIENTATION=-
MRASKRGRDRTLSNDTLETERRAASESPADHLRRTISTATHASKKSESSPSLSSLSWKLCVMITKDEAEHTKQTTHSWYCQITLPTHAEHWPEQAGANLLDGKRTSCESLSTTDCEEPA